ncbi:MAG: AraC family transcriptional regulator [Bacteroidota bacterium]|nr:AraC family transcriptional regulator [Bacteroidota bacterium]MDP4217600.1 AraC family transcriptional regulator [Bacteroidota bacterium]MDP4245901.1 AraC family transcriptional regulator [Bacteroidota bacterium]MDP4255184.1 AraC family transcriptional regulator [Bacteroidota bacterium]MDP4259231.1 AraC family transcriptional regulator [Bacteroidota bacterium]
MRPQTSTFTIPAQAYTDPLPGAELHISEELPVGLSIRIINQCSDRMDLTIPPFGEGGFTLTFISYKGEMALSIGQTRAKPELIGPGQALLSASGKPVHFGSTSPLNLSAFILFIPRGWVDEYLEGNANFKKIEMVLETEEPLISCRMGRRQMALFNSILAAHRERSPHGAHPAPGAHPANLLEVQNHALALLEFFLCNRHKSLLGPKSIGSVDNEEDLHLIREVESYIAESYCSDTFTVDSILKKTYTSYHKLNFLFKSIHGMTISEYIRNKRIERSKEMIADNVKSISQIAYEIGYSSISNYILAFKKIYQITPGKYKKQMDI